MLPSRMPWPATVLAGVLLLAVIAGCSSSVTGSQASADGSTTAVSPANGAPAVKGAAPTTTPPSSAPTATAPAAATSTASAPATTPPSAPTPSVSSQASTNPAVGSASSSATGSVTAPAPSPSVTSSPITPTPLPTLTLMLRTPLPTLTLLATPTMNVLTPTPRVPTCAQGGVCHVGERGPGGGIVFFAGRGQFICGPQRNRVCQYLEAAPIGWNGTREDAYTPWCQKRDGTWPNVFTGETLGFGLANTATITKACGGNSAAGLAAGYRGGGKSDWYLPSKDEVMEIYRQQALLGSPLLLYCWSSSQAGFSETGAWLLNFRTGRWEITYKDFPSSCTRPIRAF